VPKFRGLTTRFCPTCSEAEAHRTLYVKTESHHKSTWLRIFWACTSCDKLNHVIQPIYRLQSVLTDSPSLLVGCVPDALKEKPLDLDGLVQNLRNNRANDFQILSSEVALALEYLKARGSVKEEKIDVTERTLAALRARSAWSSHLNPCPAEAKRGVVSRGLVSLYAQHRLQVEMWGERARTGKLRLSPVGVYCVRCGFHHVDPTPIVDP
jgi:hypothetical protein